MVLLQTGINRIRDRIGADLVDGRAGTDNTLPAETDTGLIAPVAATAYDVTVDYADATLNIDHTIPSSAANGNTLAEWEVRMHAASVSMNRAVTAGVAKTSSIQVTKLTTLFLRNA